MMYAFISDPNPPALDKLYFTYRMLLNVIFSHFGAPTTASNLAKPLKWIPLLWSWMLLSLKLHYLSLYHLHPNLQPHQTLSLLHRLQARFLLILPVPSLSATYLFLLILTSDFFNFDTLYG